MCEPTTALIIASTVVASAGAGYSALMANAQAKGQANQAKANQAEANRSAADAIERGNIDQKQHYRRVSQQMGAQRAAMAANGIDIGFGSALDLVGDTAMYGEEDANALARNSRNDVRAFQIQGANFANEAKSAKLAAKGALVKGAFDVGSTILGGAQQYRKAQTQARVG